MASSRQTQQGALTEGEMRQVEAEFNANVMANDRVPPPHRPTRTTDGGRSSEELPPQILATPCATPTPTLCGSSPDSVTADDQRWNIAKSQVPARVATMKKKFQVDTANSSVLYCFADTYKGTECLQWTDIEGARSWKFNSWDCVDCPATRKHPRLGKQLPYSSESAKSDHKTAHEVEKIGESAADRGEAKCLNCAKSTRGNRAVRACIVAKDQSLRCMECILAREKCSLVPPKAIRIKTPKPVIRRITAVSVGHAVSKIQQIVDPKPSNHSNTIRMNSIGRTETSGEPPFQSWDSLTSKPPTSEAASDKAVDTPGGWKRKLDDMGNIYDVATQQSPKRVKRAESEATEPVSPALARSEDEQEVALILTNMPQSARSKETASQLDKEPIACSLPSLRPERLTL